MRGRVDGKCHSVDSNEMADILGYASVLTSMTGGTGDFRVHLSHYGEVSSKLMARVLAELKVESRGASG